MIKKQWVDLYYDKGREASLFGIKMSELSKDELIAAIGFLGETIQGLRSDHTRTLGFYKSICGIG